MSVGGKPGDGAYALNSNGNPVRNGGIDGCWTVNLKLPSKKVMVMDTASNRYMEYWNREKYTFLVGYKPVHDNDYQKIAIVHSGNFNVMLADGSAKTVKYMPSFEGKWDATLKPHDARVGEYPGIAN